MLSTSNFQIAKRILWVKDVEVPSLVTIDRGAEYRISGASATRESKRARNTGTNN